MRFRHRVLGLLILLFAITYIDRVCISVAGPRMQEDLGIDPVGWGWVTAMFTLSYCLFEIPTGALGDRIGPRRVLTRIVLWWSAFTALTGAVSNYPLLLLTRFCFGAGEAGAFPNASIVVSRWFPPRQRASISGVILMASQIGGALAPLLIVPIQMRYGWRASFFVFGAVGAVWAAAWYAGFVTRRAEMPRHQPGRARETRPSSGARAGFPWRIAAAIGDVLALLGMAFCYIYVYTFFQTWFHTFLVRGRGFCEGGLLLSALPYVVAAVRQPRRRRRQRRAGAAPRPDVGRRTLGRVGLGSAVRLHDRGAFTRASGGSPWCCCRWSTARSPCSSRASSACASTSAAACGRGARHDELVGARGGLVSSVAYGYIVERRAATTRRSCRWPPLCWSGRCSG